MSAFRCSRASQEVPESLVGTASTVRSFLLVEAPGAWGVDAVVGARLDLSVTRRLRELAREGIRPLMIRPHGRATGVDQASRGGSGTRVFAAHIEPRRQPLVETAVLDDPRELLDLPLEKLAAGRSPGMTAHADPVIAVCTHGKHDACCAEVGRPLCRALHAVDPDLVWEVSHVGGDRFAPNVLVLPLGLYYGRLAPEDAGSFISSVRAGRLDLDHLRGRTSLPFPVQAGEIYLRRRLGELDAAPLALLSHSRIEDVTRLVFLVEGARWEVRVRTDRFAPRQLTCRATSLSSGMEHHLLGITPVTW